MNYRADLAVLFEHPEWQKPLFRALDHRRVRYLPVDLKKAAFSDDDSPLAPLYFNQASPSAYVRGNTRAVPYALSYMRALQIRGVRVKRFGHEPRTRKYNPAQEIAFGINEVCRDRSSDVEHNRGLR